MGAVARVSILGLPDSSPGGSRRFVKLFAAGDGGSLRIQSLGLRSGYLWKWGKRMRRSKRDGELVLEGLQTVGSVSCLRVGETV